MRKGQGSLEYLLILAAILAIAVVVVVVAQSMLAPGQTAGEITADKYNCGLAGIELIDYDEPYATGDTLKVKFGNSGTLTCTTTAAPSPVDATCKIVGGDYTIEVGEEGASTVCKKSA